MFQYAFTRTMARRLGVKFFFPEWIGDRIFRLDDANERSKIVSGIDKRYVQPRTNCGFTEEALSITDGTDIYGFFQSEKYFLDEESVKGWFSFKDEAVEAARDKYRHLDFSASVSLHFRFGDKWRYQDMYVMPKISYYRDALSRVNHRNSLLVFSDELTAARRMAEKLPGQIISMEGNEGHEDLYLMSLCHDNICSNSTLSWWGAWLNDHADKVVVCMKEWTRPGYVQHRGMTCDGWEEIRTTHPVFGHYRIVFFVNALFRLLMLLPERIKKAFGIR